MALTINELIRIHILAGFKRGAPHFKFRYRVWIDVMGDQFLVVHAKKGVAMVYHFDIRGRFKDYGAEAIESQAWAGNAHSNDDHPDAGEQGMGS